MNSPFVFRSKATYEYCLDQRCDGSHYCLFATLTDRQLQFWEDVEEGLNDVADCYASRGENIDRIRRFAMRARGEIDLPEPSEKFHEPSEEHVDDLSAKPFWAASEFQWAAQLEENAHIIQEEFESKLQSDIFRADSKWQNNVMGAGWSAVRLQRLGVWNENTVKEFPNTYELLRSLNIPLAVRGVCFARQAGGSGVKTHSDGRNFILTHHLGLKIPDGCWIEVGNERKSWEECKLLTLDTSFTHSTGNPTNNDRYVLIIDFWHPELSESEKTALEFLYDTRNKFESGLVPLRMPTNKSRQTFGKRNKAEHEEDGGIISWWNSMVSSDGN